MVYAKIFKHCNVINVIQLTVIERPAFLHKIQARQL